MKIYHYHPNISLDIFSIYILLSFYFFSDLFLIPEIQITNQSYNKKLPVKRSDIRMIEKKSGVLKDSFRAG